MPHKDNQTATPAQTQWDKHNQPIALVSQPLPGEWRHPAWPIPGKANEEKQLVLTEEYKNRNLEIYDIEIDEIVGKYTDTLHTNGTQPNEKEIQENLRLAFGKMHEEIERQISTGAAKRRCSLRSPILFLGGGRGWLDNTGKTPFKWNFEQPLPDLLEADKYIGQHNKDLLHSLEATPLMAPARKINRDEVDKIANYINNLPGKNEAPTTLPTPADATFMVMNDGNPGHPQIGVKLKDMLNNAGNEKELISSAKDAYKTSIKADHDRISAGETEDITNTAASAEKAGAKETVKDVLETAGELTDAVSSTYDVATKGPAYINPLTGLAFEDGQAVTMRGDPHGYGNDIEDNAEFKDADSKGYFAVADLINNKGNKNHWRFAYTTADIIGSPGINIAPAGTPQLNLIDKALTTDRPLSETELNFAQQSSNLKIKFVYLGEVVGDKVKIFKTYKLDK